MKAEQKKQIIDKKKLSLKKENTTTFIKGDEIKKALTEQSSLKMAASSLQRINTSLYELLQDFKNIRMDMSSSLATIDNYSGVEESFSGDDGTDHSSSKFISYFNSIETSLQELRTEKNYFSEMNEQLKSILG